MSIIDNGVPCWHARLFIAQCRKKFPTLTPLEKVIKDAREFSKRIENKQRRRKTVKK
jgi:hypothetical protein